MRTLMLVTLLAAAAAPAVAQPTDTVTLRGHPQTVRLYGMRGGPPVIVSSGDGGWMHLGPHVAEVLAAKGYFVVGFDTRAYLTSFTSRQTTLRVEDEPGDYQVLADFAARGARQKPILIGVSEGAGLSLLAATDPATKARIGGVLGLGLPDVNELGWRWKDALDLHHPRRAQRADVQHRGSCKPGGAHAAGRDPLEPGRVRAAGRSPARARRRARTQAAVGGARLRPPLQ